MTNAEKINLIKSLSTAPEKEEVKPQPGGNTIFMQGPAGYTPIKGLDYMTSEEVLNWTELIAHEASLLVEDGYSPVKGLDYDDGYTPIKGVDYNDGEDGKTPQKGDDYFTEEDKEELVNEVLVRIPQVKEVTTEEIEQIIESKKEVVDYTKFATVEQLTNFLKKGGFRGGGSGGGGSTTTSQVKTWTPSTAYTEGDFALNEQTGAFLQRINAGTSLTTFSALEGQEWTYIAQTQPFDFVANTYYYDWQLMAYDGVQYTREADGVSGATFDTAEQDLWLTSGTYGNGRVKTVDSTDSPYTLSTLDEQIYIDSSAGAIIFNLPSNLPEGRFFTITYTQTANAITITATGGTTVVNPSTFLPVASWVAPGTVGQVGSTQFYRIGNVWYFNG